MVDLPDGGLISIEWSADDKTLKLPANAPILAILPTVNGDAPSMKYFLQDAADRGFRGVVLNRRGHADKLKTPQFDIMGNVADTVIQIDLIAQKYPGVFIGMAGVSAGSGLLVSFMG